MTDASVTVDSKLKTAFAAARPHRQIADAEAFISTMRGLSETGAKPSSAALETGAQLLDNLERQAVVYLFQAAVLAGQEAASTGELERKVQSIGKEAERVENTTRQLRSMLQNLA